jgi:hypothetical protein
MSYYLIGLNGKIHSENVGYFITTTIYSAGVENAVRDVKKIIFKKMMKEYELHTDEFFINDIEKINFMQMNTNFYFYNL